MRKVYQQEKNKLGLAVAVSASVALTALLFAVIPFAHRLNKPGDKTLELVKTTTVEAEEQVEETPPPEIEPEDKPPEAAPEPELAETEQAIPLSADLEVATGSGGALAGFGADIKSLTAVTDAAQDVFDVSDLEKRPEPTSQVAPAYPAELRKARVEGVVTLVFLLDETGRVEDPRVENSSRPEFDKPALEAIRKWRFSPGMKDGQPVRTYIRVPMRFRVSAG
jgi:protein TonB